MAMLNYIEDYNNTRRRGKGWMLDNASFASDSMFNYSFTIGLADFANAVARHKPSLFRLPLASNSCKC